MPHWSAVKSAYLQLDWDVKGSKTVKHWHTMILLGLWPALPMPSLAMDRSLDPSLILEACIIFFTNFSQPSLKSPGKATSLLDGGGAGGGEAANMFFSGRRRRLHSHFLRLEPPGEVGQRPELHQPAWPRDPKTHWLAQRGHLNLGNFKKTRFTELSFL